LNVIGEFNLENVTHFTKTKTADQTASPEKSTVGGDAAKNAKPVE
jgi:hypothetical protein